MLLAAVTTVTLLAGGFAVAKTFTCKATGLCRGTQQADKITGTNQVNTILGLAGKDQISAGNAADTVDGGRQNDTLNGGGGNDTYRFTSAGGPPGADRISADASGVDRVDYSRLAEPISVTIAESAGFCPQNSRLCLSLGGNFIENLTGTDFDDELFGTTRDNSVIGGQGDDALVGGTADDVLNGGAGLDSVFGQAGADRLVGGAGTDELVGDVGDDHLDGGTEVDEIFGGPGRDTLNGQAGTDSLVGEGADDDLDGGTEDDAYFFASNWGADEITDGDGDLDAVRVTNDPAIPDLTVDLNAGSGPELAGDGRVEWSGGIELVQVGLGDDEFTQSPQDNLMVDLGGSDTYAGYDGGDFGTDWVIDAAGTNDTLDLTAFDTTDMTWAFAGDTSGNVVGLSLRFPAGSTDGSRLIVRDHFQGSAGAACASVVGPGRD